MDDALAISGFYFTLIGFVSGLFFTRLDGWYGSVREFEGGLSVLVNKPGTRDQFEEARIKLKGLLSSRPSGSFAAIGILMTALLTLSLFVPVSNSNLNPLFFLRVPLIATVVAYWIGGISLLRKGKRILELADANTSEALKG